MSIRRSKTRPVVALVGRTNVGKSTLWNRLTSSTRALVSDKPHTTRDRNYGVVTWLGGCFDLIDTGGMDVEKNEIGQGILTQSENAMKEADLVLFVVDGQAGMSADDLRLAKRTKELRPDAWIVINKIDTIEKMPLAQDKTIYATGLPGMYPVSAATSLGIGDLLDAVVQNLESRGMALPPEHEALPLRIAIIGRPNVGKSSLMNAILGTDRVIVSAIEHTTREPQDTWFEYEGRDIVLVDTAGMRKAAHIKDKIEHAGIDRNMQAIKDADIALLVFDATEDPKSQDRHLGGMLQESHKGLILVANKWDLIPDKTPKTADQYEFLVRQLFPFLDWAPMIFTSAKEGVRTSSLIDLALKVQEERHRKIDYNAINRLLKNTIKKMRPLAEYGPKSPRIWDVAQIGEAPPSFMITVVGEKDNISPNWVKFFQRQIRNKFGFIGTPIITRARNLPPAKSSSQRNYTGPGMEAVAGPIREKPRLVNQTRRRQKLGGRRY